LTALENVELAGTLAGWPRHARRTRAAALLEAVGLSDRAGHRPVELSGGERQRVAMARAVANDPRVLLADEPTGNLDQESAGMVIELLESLHRDRACTLLIVTHNGAIARRAPRRLRLVAGRLGGS
jgi:putative ABC transport system ATP-binding protein